MRSESSARIKFKVERLEEFKVARSDLKWMFSFHEVKEVEEERAAFKNANSLLGNE